MSIKSPRELLETAIALNFDDLAAHAAYADLLIEEGDPRGEYIQLKLALENPNQSALLLRDWREQAARIYQTHEGDWLGSLARFLLNRTRATVDPVAPNIEFAFTRGWLTEIHVQDVRDAFTTVLAHAPEARMLQTLSLFNTNLPNNRGPLDPLLDSPNLHCLKRFTLGDPEAYEPTADGRFAVALVQQMPQLRELELRASNVNVRELFGLPLPHLQTLLVDYLTVEPLEILAANSSLKELTRLRLCNQPIWQPPEQTVVTDPAIDGYSTMKLRYLLQAKQLRNLTHLTLRIGTLGDEGCTELVRSGILRQLRRLDLRYCGITDLGAEVLARSPDLRHLEWLDVGGNRLTLVGISAFQEADIRVQWDSQWGEYLAPDEGEDLIA